MIQTKQNTDVSPIPTRPGALPVFGHLFEFRKDPLAFIQECRKNYGDLVRLKLAGANVFLVNNPEAIHEILVVKTKNFKKSRALQLAKELLGDGLVTSEGDFHLKQRRMIAPAFKRDRINDYARIMGAETAKFRSRLKDGERFDLHSEMMRLTLAIVSRTLFSADVEGDAKEVGEALHSALSMFQRVTNPFAKILAKIPLPATLKFRKAKAQLFAVIDRIIEEHRGKDYGDLLSMLLAAVDEDDASTMSLKQVRDEALTLFLAGHETTANALTWCFYLLANNPIAQEKMFREVDEVSAGIKENDFIPPELFTKLQYTKMVLSEGLRLYPPAWMIGRQSLEEFELGGRKMPKNAIFLMSQYVVHRDSRFFPEPERFKPERWENEDPSRPKFAYFPFGGGPRTCIGDHFAWMEGTLLLAEISRFWKFEPVAGHTVVPQPLITLRPKHGVLVDVRRRW